jgi:hypothetical protein
LDNLDQIERERKRIQKKSALEKKQKIIVDDLIYLTQVEDQLNGLKFQRSAIELKATIDFDDLKIDLQTSILSISEPCLISPALRNKDSKNEYWKPTYMWATNYEHII